VEEEDEDMLNQEKFLIQVAVLMVIISEAVDGLERQTSLDITQEDIQEIGTGLMVN
jgi:hypothetical protein